MKTNLFLIALVYSISAFGQTPSNDQHWQLVWQDDFNSFDSNKWIKANYATHGTEPQLYLESNVYTSNGQLIIKTNNNAVTCPPNPIQTTYACGICNQGQTYSYNSGWVETNNNFNTQYGFIEARISLPYGYGFWPAFWTWRGNGVTTSNEAEIDIFEVYGSKPSTMYGTNVHLSYTPPINFPMDLLLYSYANTYHTYGIEWSPSKIIWYIDGYPVRLLPNVGGVVDPVRIILNLAIEPSYLPNSSTPFPSEMSIDYVKVYELNKDCNNFINSGNYDFSTYDNKVKNFIEIGDDGCSNSIAVGDNVTLRASQYIDINGDFYVPLGASFYADADKGCSIDIGTLCTQTFNPCIYNFSNYDNSIKKAIELGGNGCNINITPTINNIILQATDQIILKDGVTITATSGKSVELKIVPCQ